MSSVVELGFFLRSRERKREHLESLQHENERLRTYTEHVESHNEALKASLEGAKRQIYVGMTEISRLRASLRRHSAGLTWLARR